MRSWHSTCTPLIVDAPAAHEEIGPNACHRRSVARSAGLFLRGAHLDVVWGEIKQADGWLIALVRSRRPWLNMVHQGAPMAVSARPDRARAVSDGVSHDDDRICRQHRASGARRRSDPAVSAGAAGRTERDGDICHDRRRAAARQRDGGVDAGGVRAVLRSGNGAPTTPCIDAVRLGGLVGRRRHAGPARRDVFRGAAIRRRSGAGRTSSSICCQGGSRTSWPELLQQFRRRPGSGARARAAADGAGLSVPLWLSIALGIWTVTLAFHIEMPFTGSFLLLALLVVGVAVPTPGGVGGFEAAVQIGLDVVLSACRTIARSARRWCCTRRRFCRRSCSDFCS